MDNFYDRQLSSAAVKHRFTNFGEKKLDSSLQTAILPSPLLLFDFSPPVLLDKLVKYSEKMIPFASQAAKILECFQTSSCQKTKTGEL